MPVLEAHPAPCSVVDTGLTGTRSFLAEHRRLVVKLLCLYAALRILIFSAAFPLFNPTDEQFHFDAVNKWANGYHAAPGLPLVNSDSARIFALYESPEYLSPRDALIAFHLDQPIAFLPSPLREAKFAHWSTYWNGRKNFEIHAPPVYYAIASLWFRLGHSLGFADWSLAYWLRFFNAFAFAALVWLGFAFVNEVYPDRPFLGIAVPALLAVFPQDIFLGINREVLSAPLDALALLLLFRGLPGKPRCNLYLAAGSLCIGLAFLTDVSNAVFFLALFAVIAVRLVRTAPGKALLESGLLLLSTVLALIPPALWMIHNHQVFGDLTASRDKIAALGWTVKPFSEIWHHPIFSFSGAFYFLQGVMKTYWRGEFVWYGKPMSLAFTDWIFILSSYFLLGVFAARFLVRRPSTEATERLSDRLALALLGASFLFLIVLSLPFDFGGCFYPSRALPFFISGRIISGTLLPFAIMFASGLEIVLSRFRRWISAPLALVVLLVLITVADFQAKSVAFSSPFNFFSLSMHGATAQGLATLP